MRIRTQAVLNWLDARLRPVSHPDFHYRTIVSDRGEPSIEIHNLKVLLYCEGTQWIAHGLDIGYVSSGETPEKAQERFERGLGNTIAVNLQRFGNADRVIRPAPPEVWLRWRSVARHVKQAHKKSFNQNQLTDFFPQPRVELAYYGCC